MFCQAGFDQWRTTIMHHLSHLSKPQATVLALWSFGMVLACSCALTAVSSLLATGTHRKEQAVRQQLREWYYDAKSKRVPSAKRCASRPALRPCWAGWCAGGRARSWRWPSMPPPWGNALWCWRSAWSIVAVPSPWRGGSCPRGPSTPGAAHGSACCVGWGQPFPGAGR